MAWAMVAALLVTGPKALDSGTRYRLVKDTATRDRFALRTQCRELGSQIILENEMGLPTVLLITALCVESRQAFSNQFAFARMQLLPAITGTHRPT